MDDARSLQGGSSSCTPLKGADGQVYAVAQGPLSVGGFAVAGQAAGVQKNQLNTGRMPNGAMIEKEAPRRVGARTAGCSSCSRTPDFNTARLIAKAINARFPNAAEACDPGARESARRSTRRRRCADLIAEVGLLEVKPDAPAQVIINERTGTVVAGENVTIGPVAVAHGNLFVSLRGDPAGVAAGPVQLAGSRRSCPRTQVTAAEQRSRMVRAAEGDDGGRRGAGDERPRRHARGI